MSAAGLVDIFYLELHDGKLENTVTVTVGLGAASVGGGNEGTGGG